MKEAELLASPPAAVAGTGKLLLAAGGALTAEGAGPRCRPLCLLVSLGLRDLALADSLSIAAGFGPLSASARRPGPQPALSRPHLPLGQWGDEMFVRAPYRLFHDRCLWLAMVMFWGIFLCRTPLLR